LNSLAGQRLDLVTERLDRRDIGVHAEGDIVQQTQLGDRIGFQSLHVVAVDVPTSLTGQLIFDRQDVCSATPDQLLSPPCRIAYGTFTRRKDVARGQYAQPEQMRQVPCICFVAAVFQAVIGLDGAGIGEPHLIARSHRPIDQPIPVVS
jgi:hypothetical protein